MKEIKAIETNYKGYKFRSRLEARWAVFFDAAGIAWEYEPEGYVMSDGTCYLPDFYLPSEDIFVEVKGVMPDDDVFEKLKLFSVEKGTPVLLACGILEQGKGVCEIYMPNAGRWKTCWVGVHPRKELIFLCGGYFTDEKAMNFLAEEHKNELISARSSAVTAMKQARFEFL